MNKTLGTTALLAIAVVTTLAPLTSFAAKEGSRPPAHVATTTPAGGRSATPSAALTRAKHRVEQEIDRRAAQLQALANRIGDMTRMSDADKSALQQVVMEQASGLAEIKRQLEADMSTSSLKSAIESINSSYRVYALVIPQTTILASADRANELIVQMQAIGGKLAARLTEAAAAGHDVATLQTTLAEYRAKITDAEANVQAASTAVRSLRSDTGDRAVQQSNLTALKDARSKLQAAHQDLVAARKDAGIIVKGLRAFKSSENAASTTPAS